MSAFLQKFLQYAIGLSFIMAFISAFTLYRYYENRIPVIKKKLLKEHLKSNSSLNLILGSSHTLHGINSNLIGLNYFNASSVSQGLMEDYHIIRYISSKTKIDTVIFSISYFTNHYYLDNTTIPGEKLRALDYKISYDIKYNKALTLYDYILILSISFNDIFRNSDKFDSNGNLMPFSYKLSRKISDAQAAFDRHNSMADFSNNHQYLDSIINICNQQNIHLYFVVMPYSAEYNKYIDKTEFDNWIYNIQKKYPSSSIINARNLFVKAKESDLFRDADHLSASGREIFSLKLRSIIHGVSRSFHSG
jgi:hypothetical protein